MKLNCCNVIHIIGLFILLFGYIVYLTDDSNQYYIRKPTQATGV